MSDPIIQQIEAAAAPALVAALRAVQQFITDMGTDPTQWLLRYPGATQKMLGTIELQLPVLEAAEAAALAGDAQTVVAGWISKLQALTPAK